MIYPRSIRQKLFLGVLLTTISALVIAGIAMVVYELRDYRTQLVDDLSTQSRLLGLASAPALRFSDRDLAARSLALIEARPMIVAAAVYSADGELFTSYSAAGSARTEFPARVPHAGITVAGETIALTQRVIDHDEMLGSIYLKAHYELHSRVWQYAGIVCSALVIALVISTLLSLWMQAKVTGPILGITQLARQVTEQRNYDLRAVKITDDEIGFLVDAFNELLSEVGTRSAALELSNTKLQQQVREREEADSALQRLNAELEQRVIERTGELERANKELEAFSYSVSHDLRTPLRAIDGFSQALLEDYEPQLDATGRDYLARVRAGAQRMGGLIDDLLKLARVSRTPLVKAQIDLSAMAGDIAAELRASQRERAVDFKIEPQLLAIGDLHLLRIALENLLNNAWKYTGKSALAAIEFGQGEHNGKHCYFVRDNGAGFDMAYAGKLFGAFQRLHEAKEFPGTGVGLATVQRIIHRHGGEIWAEAEVNNGSTFYFTLPAGGGYLDEH